MKLFSSLGRDLGIDIGTMHTHVFVQGRGVVISEPSVVATDAKFEQVVSIGEEAERMLLRSEGVLNPLRPLEDGVIVDYRVVLAMLRYFMNKASKSVRRSKVVVSVPCGITDVERRAMTDAILQAGAREAYLIESPVASALGANLPIFEARGSMVVDIGGGTTDIGILSLGGTVASKSIRVGGSNMNEALLQYIRECFSVMVAPETVEDIKLALGSALPTEEDEEVYFQGRDVTSGLLKRLVIRKSEVYGVLKVSLQVIVEEIHRVIEQTSPEIISDIMEQGILLTGAVASMKGLREYMEKELHIPVYTPQEPGFTVALGLGRAVSEINRLERFILATKHRKGNG